MFCQILRQIYLLVLSNGMFRFGAALGVVVILPFDESYSANSQDLLPQARDQVTRQKCRVVSPSQDEERIITISSEATRLVRIEKSGSKDEKWMQKDGVWTSISPDGKIETGDTTGSSLDFVKSYLAAWKAEYPTAPISTWLSDSFVAKNTGSTGQSVAWSAALVFSYRTSTSAPVAEPERFIASFRTYFLGNQKRPPYFIPGSSDLASLISFPLPVIIEGNEGSPVWWTEGKDVKEAKWPSAMQGKYVNFSCERPEHVRDSDFAETLRKILSQRCFCAKERSTQLAFTNLLAISDTFLTERSPSSKEVALQNAFEFLAWGICRSLPAQYEAQVKDYLASGKIRKDQLKSVEFGEYIRKSLNEALSKSNDWQMLTHRVGEYENHGFSALQFEESIKEAREKMCVQPTLNRVAKAG
jgi:hypothetical protein